MATLSTGNYDPSTFNAASDATFAPKAKLTPMQNVARFFTGASKPNVTPPPGVDTPPSQWQALWGTQQPHALAPAHPDPIGSHSVLGNNYVPNTQDDYQTRPLHSEPPPTAAQFPKAAYANFTELHNWPDTATNQISENQNQPTIIYRVIG